MTPPASDPPAAASTPSRPPDEAPGRRGPRRRRLVAGLAVAAVLVLAAVLLGARSGGSSGPPAALATRLVPADALVYVHLSTDRSRRGTAAADTLAGQFSGYAKLKRTLVRRLSAPGCRLAGSVLSHGREAAFALVDTGSGRAGSLVYVDTGDARTAPDRTCGAIQTAKLGRFLVIGQPPSIAIARRLAAGRGRTLAADPGYRRTLRQLPAERVADAWVSQAGVTRLLTPQGGIIGAAGTLLDQPGLRATAAALTVGSDGAHVVLRSLRQPPVVAAAAADRFTPTLQNEVPDNAMAFLDLRGLTGTAGRLLGLAGAQAPGLAPLLARAGADLAPLLGLFAGETAATITPATPAAVLSIITRVKDPAAARAILAAARPKVARLLAASPSAIPQWQTIGDRFRLQPATGVEIDYSVIRDLVVVSTRRSGLDAVRGRVRPLAQGDAWLRTVGDTRKPITSLVFLDFNQLLRLGEQTGLNGNKAYLAAKYDLQKLQSVGVHSSSAGDETTAELLLSFL